MEHPAIIFLSENSANTISVENGSYEKTLNVSETREMNKKLKI
jgi:hypothetical protein